MARAAALLLAVGAALLAPPAAVSGPSWGELCAANAGRGIIAFCAKALAEDPDNRALRRHYAKALLLGGAERRAVEEYRRLAERLPADAVAQYELAGAYAAVSRYADAVPPLERALALRPNHLETMMLAGLVYQILGRSAEAFPLFLKLAEGGDVLAMYDVALGFEHGDGVAKDEAQALRWLVRAGEAGHVDALERLSEVYRRGRRGVAPDAGAAAAWATRAAAERDRPHQD